MVSLVHACLTFCNFDNITHAINETLISIAIFWHKPKVFVEINGPLSSLNFYNKFIHFLSSNTNTIHVISEKVKNYAGDCKRHSKIYIIGQYLKSIAFTKFDTAQLLPAEKIQMTACSKEKRTLFKTRPKLCYKL